MAQVSTTGAGNEVGVVPVTHRLIDRQDSHLLNNSWLRGDGTLRGELQRESCAASTEEEEAMSSHM